MPRLSARAAALVVLSLALGWPYILRTLNTFSAWSGFTDPAQVIDLPPAESGSTSGDQNQEEEAVTLEAANDENYDRCVITFGLPGGGKSTILNSITGEPLFQWCDGPISCTQAVGHQTVNGITFLDTPGLMDAANLASAAAEVKKAFTLCNSYKLLWVTCFQHGQVVSDWEIGAVYAVLESIRAAVDLDAIPVVIAANKIDPKFFKPEHAHRLEYLETEVHRRFSPLRASADIHYLPWILDQETYDRMMAEGMMDIPPSLVSAFTEGFFPINKELVQKIDTSERWVKVLHMLQRVVHTHDDVTEDNMLEFMDLLRESGAMEANDVEELFEKRYQW